MKVFILSILFCFPLFASRIKVIVIDSGVGNHQINQPYMCKNASKTLVGNGKFDNSGHGTNIISIIQQGINVKTHCIVSYKIWYAGISGEDSIAASIKALRLALNSKNVGFVNISMGGPEPHKMEKFLIKQLLINNVKVVVAAGNGDGNGKAINLDKNCEYFPACYKKTLQYTNFYVVTANLYSSNYGAIVTDKLNGINIGIPKRSGTSQATASKTSQLLKKCGILKYRSLYDRSSFPI